MAALISPITRQIAKGHREPQTLSDVRLEDVQDCLVFDRHGVSLPFKNLYQHGKSVIIFVRVGKVSKSYGSLFSAGY